jgi:glycosyltransferase involved in cell wall biosynthesis
MALEPRPPPADAPMLSIVTSAYNAAATLGDTLESVRRQLGVRVEHILIDGGSRDRTADVVARHGSHLRHFVSAPDRGIYDGMNKGAALARGDIIGFLNADDWLAGPEALRPVAQAFAQGADFIYGNLVFVDAQAPYTVRRVWTDAPHTCHDFFQRGWQPAHPTTYIRRELFEAWGGFDLRWRIAADYALIARAMRHPGLRLRHVDATLVNMRLGGTSTAGAASVWRANLECAQALKDLGASHPWWTITRKLARKLPQLRRLQGPHDFPALWRPWDAEGQTPR